ncbi:MAG TPA: hypothetical protein VD969_04805 [Symbiobacteriaceae bacterium]|nr:hypothetical protein [Symbiobacteriaceae bacterium]
MFKLSTEYGTVPYDGFYIYAYSLPRPDFIARVQGQVRTAQPYALRHTPRTRRQALWANFVSLPIAGEDGALKVMWDPLDPWSGIPLSRVYFNPSTTGYDAQQTYDLLLTILDDPLSAVMASLDTKVDVEAPYWLVAGHIYYSYARYLGHADWLADAGTIYEGKKTRLSIYAKLGEHNERDRWWRERDDEEPVAPITRVEMRQRFVKPRPTFGDFLRGALVETNKLRQLKVVEDLDKLGDRVLAEEAQKRGGLTRVLREYQEFANVSKADIAAMKENINAIATREIFDHYRRQAEVWHRTFRG